MDRVIADLASKSEEIHFLTADISPSILRRIAEASNANLSGIVRAYFWINDSTKENVENLERVRKCANIARIRFIPLLHTKLIIFKNAGETKSILMSGNLTRRSMERELNHFAVITNPNLNRKLVEDYELLWSKSTEGLLEEPPIVMIKQLDKANMHQKKVKKLARKYLNKELSLKEVARILNLSIPFYQLLFLSLISEELYIFMYLIELEAAKKLLVPPALNGAEIKIIASTRVSASLEDKLNGKIRELGGEVIMVKRLPKIHAKTIIAKTKRNDFVCYIGTASITRSSLFTEINHGILVTNEKMISRLLKDFRELFYSS